MKRRIVSIITALALCLSLCPTWAFAVEAEPDTGLCVHHPYHTDECGYIAPSEGQPCGHEHTDDCYTIDEDGGEVLDCQHTHDSECGYIQADPGQPCGYECKLCPIEALIAALPGALTEDNRAEVEAQLQEILDLYREVSEDEQEQLDMTLCSDLQAALDEANTPAPIDELTEGAVAQVEIAGSITDCNTIEEAWAAANGKTATITLLVDVTAGGTLTVDAGSTITLKGGDYTLTSGEQTAIQVNGTLKLESGTVKSTYSSSGARGINVNGTLEITGGAVAASTRVVSASEAVHADSGGNIIVSGGSLSGIWGILVDGGTATIKNGEISAQSRAIEVNTGTVTIEGGTFTGVAHGLNVKSGGTAVLRGGTFTGGNGGYAIYSKTVLSGLLAQTQQPGTYYAYFENGKPVALEDGQTSLDGGTFTVGECNHEGGVQDQGNGTHGGNCPYCGTEFAEEPHTLGEGNKCEGCGATLVAQVEIGNATTYYGTIESAWTAAKGSTATITLLASVKIGNPLMLNGGNITVIGRGHRITSEDFVFGVGGGKLAIESGTFSGGTAAIVTVGSANVDTCLKNYGDNSVSEHYAYFDENDAPIDVNKLTDPTQSPPTVTVRECTHPEVIKDQGNGTHGGNCPYCGAELAAAPHTLGAGNKCEGCGAPLKVQVEIGNDTTYYGDIGAAWTAVEGKTATITLLDDVTKQTSLPVSSGSNVTLNGGSHTLSIISFMVGSGQLDITGGTFEMNAGLNVSGGTVHLSGGTFRIGSGGGIYCSSGVASLLLNYGSTNASDKHYAYFDEAGKPIAMEEGQTTLTSTVTVRECKHEGVKATPNNDGTHSLNCPYCGYTEAAEDCNYGTGYKHDENSHWQTCEVCGYQKTEAHTLNYEPGDTVNGVTTNYERCDCGFFKAFTVTVTVPSDLTYGNTGGKRVSYTVNPVKSCDTEWDLVDMKGNPLTMEDDTLPANLPAGDYRLQIYGYNGGKPAFAGTTIFTVAPVTLTPTITGTTTKTYDGKNTAPDDLAIVLTGVVDGDTVTATASFAYDNPNAGTRTITASDITLDGTSKNNYTLSSTTATITGTITKADVTITTPPTAQTLVYTGAAQALVSPGEANVGKVVYSLEENGTYSEDIPTGTNADAYTVWYKVDGNGNYNGVAPESVNVTISRKSVTPTVTITPSSYEYTSQQIKPGEDANTTVIVKDGNDVIPASEYTLSYGENIHYGTGTVTATDNGSGNYSFAAVTGNFAITKKLQATLSITGKPDTVVYGDTFPLATAGGSGEGAVTWTVTSGPATVSASGEVRITGVGSVAIKAVKAGGTDYEDADATLTFEAAKRPIIATVTAQSKTYDGTSAATVTAAVTNSDLVSGDSITISGLVGTFSDANVGEGKTVTVDSSNANITGTNAGNYIVTFPNTTASISKADAKIITAPAAVQPLAYNGTAQELVSAGTADFGEVVYALSKDGDYSEAIPTGTDAGSYTVWYKVEGTDNYNGTVPVKVDVTIRKATAPTPQAGTLNVQNGYARDYTFTLTQLLPTLASGQTFGGDVIYTLKSVNITEAGYYTNGAEITGSTLIVPIKSVTATDESQIGTITVTLSCGNFEDVDATINVHRVNREPVEITGVTAENVTYDGKPHNGYTGTPKAGDYTGDFIFAYAKADGTALSGAPTNAGSYTVTITLKENDRYTGSRVLNFTIEKASITITADDKRADVGTAKPDLTYTVNGLVGTDTLATAPTLTCNADMDTIGQYTITASGAVVPNGGNYNAEITYVPGTLTVTDPTIHVTGVTLNKTSTTLTVGGSERLTATVAPSDATDKGVTWTSSNTAVATVDASGNVTAVSVGTATITVTTADGGKTATCAVTVNKPSSGPSGGGDGYVPSNPTSSVTVPVSGDRNTVRISASVSGSTATVSKIDTSQIDSVIGGTAQTSMVDIDFTGLGRTIDTVKLPTDAITEIATAAQNKNVGGLTVKLSNSEISFNGDALAAIQAQAGSQITLTVTPAKASDLNARQKEAVGSAPVYDLTLQSNGRTITDFRGGYATVSLPYTLAAGQNPSGVVVYYLDSTGNITPCTTMYDVRSQSAIFTTSHLSLYFVGYDPAAVWVNPFSDVAGSAWYYDAVQFVNQNGLMNGYSNGTFGPNDYLSRAMLAQILYNRAGKPAVTGGSTFTDVAPGQWYTNAVIWANQNGIVSGYGNGLFGPNDNITREQLATMLWRYAGSPAATDKELHFADADQASGYALEALCWAAENGILNGYGDGRLGPRGTATRAQVAQMLKNFIEAQKENP